MSTDSPGPAAQNIVTAWKGRFAALAEIVVGDGFRQDGDGLQVSFGGSSAVLSQTEAGRSVELGAISGPEPARMLRELATRSGTPNNRSATVVLPGNEVLRPSVRLPRASHQNLRRALGYELERLSPVSPDAVYFDFEILDHDRETNMVDVELRIIRRDIVDRAVSLCRDAGLPVSEILFSGDAKPADWRVFPVDRNAFLLAQAWRRRVGLLAGLAAALLIGVLLAAYLRGAAVADDLTDEVGDEGIRAAQVEHLRHRIDQATTQLAFLEKQKRGPLFVAVLNDVTRVLPDGTWITELDMSGGKIRIEGYSHAASDLIGIFDRSGRFTNAQFSAPVTQAAAQGVERFDLTFDIAGGKT